jgi:hypothetical protein
MYWDIQEHKTLQNDRRSQHLTDAAEIKSVQAGYKPLIRVENNTGSLRGCHRLSVTSWPGQLTLVKKDAILIIPRLTVLLQRFACIAFTGVYSFEGSFCPQTQPPGRMRIYAPQTRPRTHIASIHPFKGASFPITPRMVQSFTAGM